MSTSKLYHEFGISGYARGSPQSDNIFDEESERIWTSIWLLNANPTRLTSAMAVGGDYGVFADGRFQKTEQVYRLHEYLKNTSAAQHQSTEKIIGKR